MSRIWQTDGKSDFAIRLPMARTERTYERTNERLQDSSKHSQEPHADRPVDERKLSRIGLRELMDEAFEARDWHRTFWIAQIARQL